MKTKKEISEYQKNWREDNKERFNNLRKNWNKKNPEKLKEIRKKCKIKIHKRQRELDNIRQNTRRKYGRLKKGFVYHHTTAPYERDKVIILEERFHRFYHNNIGLFKKDNVMKCGDLVM